MKRGKQHVIAGEVGFRPAPRRQYGGLKRSDDEFEKKLARELRDDFEARTGKDPHNLRLRRAEAKRRRKGWRSE